MRIEIEEGRIIGVTDFTKEGNDWITFKVDDQSMSVQVELLTKWLEGLVWTGNSGG